MLTFIFGLITGLIIGALAVGLIASNYLRKMFQGWK